MKYLLSVFQWGEEKVASSELSFKKGDVVVVDLGFGKHLGKILGPLKDEEEKKYNHYSNGEEYSVLRKATAMEKEKIKLSAEKRDSILQKCRQIVKRHDLPMKLVGVDISIEGGGIIFGFTAEERIDFRSLVRELAGVFQKSVRLQQIGSRDEAKSKGGLGPCGRPLCCLFETIPSQSISTEMARLQQINHRGSERLSGCCNRLMCCLAFEQDTYEKMRQTLPNVGDKIKIPGGGEGTIEHLRVLTQEVGIKTNKDQKEITWFKIDEIKIVK